MAGFSEESGCKSGSERTRLQGKEKSEENSLRKRQKEKWFIMIINSQFKKKYY